MTDLENKPVLSPKERLVREGIEGGHRALSGPFGIQIGITNYCSFTCEFCPGFSYKIPATDRKEKKQQIDPAVFMNLLDDCAALDVEQVSLVGVGEPLFHQEIVPFVEAIRRRNMRAMLTSNGAALTVEKATLLAEAGLSILNVSVNAATEATYEKVIGPGRGPLFHHVIDTLTRLASLPSGKRPRLSLRFVVSATSAEEIVPFASLAATIGVDEVVYQNCVPHAHTQDIALSLADRLRLVPSLEEAERLLSSAAIVNQAGQLATLYSGRGAFMTGGYDFYRTHACFVGWTYAMIVENGDVTPCCYCSAPFGNINERSFREIWEGEEYCAFRRAISSLPETHTPPHGCRCFVDCGSIGDNLRTRRRLNLSQDR